MAMLVVKGRQISPQQIELDEPLPAGVDRVEVIVEQAPRATGSALDLMAWVRSLPPGTRTKEDIDAQIREEREAWGE